MPLKTPYLKVKVFYSFKKGFYVKRLLENPLVLKEPFVFTAKFISLETTKQSTIT